MLRKTIKKKLKIKFIYKIKCVQKFINLVSNLSEDSYDYVFGGRRKPPPSTTALKLTSPPVRLRPEGNS